MEEIPLQKVLLCAFCAATRRPEDVRVASTIMNGQAVCTDHAYYVQGGEFNRILEIIKRDIELKKEVTSSRSTTPKKSASPAPSASPRSRSISSLVRSAVSSARTPDQDASP